MITLYKRSKSGKVQVWSIETEGNKFRTIEGFVDGVKTTGEWTICKGKNIDSSNETSPEEQAIKEAKAKIVKKQESGYTENIDEVDSAKVKIAPMLAHKWVDYKDEILGEKNIAIQPKLDGIRCIATKDGLFSRNGKQIVAVPHIWEEAKKLLSSLPEGTFLDGELYNHELKSDFNKIISLVRKTKPTSEDLEESKKLVQYHIYDIGGIGGICELFDNRSARLYSALHSKHYTFLVEVATIFLHEDDELKLDRFYAKWLEEGYEGQMIRISNSYYENSRSKNLLKRKEFMDEEFEIVDIQEGVGGRSGMMGRVCFKMKNGKTFDSNARGSHEYFKELLINKGQYIGKMATVRFQNYTPDGSLRFPVMIAVRDFE